MPPVTSPGSDQLLRDRHAPHHPTTARPHPRFGDREAARVRFRRALALLLMTLVLPGSAQLVAGNKRVGRVALRVVLTLLAVTVFVGLVGWKWHGVVYFLASNTVALGFLRLLLAALAVGWAVLFLDAWRLGQPLELLRKQRLAMVGLNGVLCFSVAGGLLFASHVVAVQRGFIATMFGSGTVSEATHGRYNVLLLGGDSGQDRWGLRPDSISVASIDQETGKAILFGLPRNMTNFPFPEGSVMAEQFPDGYDCGPECELNSLSTWAQDNKALFPGEDNPGVAATIEGVEGITGLKINYYAMVNLDGFRSLVQAVGGLELNVRDRIPIGGVGGPVTGYIEPGVQRLNGFQTLWFARSRESADDYSRMARQKCVMNAMLQQLSPQTVITKFEDIASASEQLITTDLPASELGTFAELAMKTRGQPVSSVSFVPPAINTGAPDIEKIHAMVQRAIDKAEGKATTTKAAAAKKQKGFSRAGSSTVGGSIGSYSEGYAANKSNDLSSAC
ncbi:LCP family protein [Nocardioides iriomotensis]|uniref:LytR family transcriptional regulator n=1 Tax=Nocardioides iriomotensis TaxID=715784 RepID=A0A4Q5J5I1_9ACTN|nr:LCP family protein [Nocardioides iriomotensis]RYU12821.1 LytR family transcriptional regulator [Nocardioides iriomotensis]